MTDSTPPSIPPRQRPTPPTTSGRSTTSSRANPTSAWTVTPVEAGAPTTSGRSTTSSAAPSASSATDETTRTVTKASSNGSSTSERAKPPVRSSSKPPVVSKPVESEAKPADPKPADPKPAERKPAEAKVAEPKPRADEALLDADEDQPSPLMVAVDSTTSWLKKVAASTSAAITTAARPRPEDTPMTSIPVATPPATAGAPRPVAGANPAGAAARPSTGRIPTVQSSSGPRRVRLAISRLDPWSVMKLSFLLSVAIGIMLVVGVAVGWFTLNELHVFTKVDDLVTQVTGQEAGGPDILQYVEFQKVISAATLLAVIDVFLLTALSTIGAFLYNIVAALVGGVHVTMTDE
ncbi:DUF3566 domain-containing protein [Cellulomonas rhizosphaerae]|uniref:DUF3566 domain-containing protein n=1 Tax=Cellulomonas rhizosphaerae TaxID=2293719 RepID=A0A413RKH8_9CELL|nr:DUF3566 domain-containing protein [Cellulomonas rhizosphaerae]RHA39617.1 hypothetical protein D1825_11550 [Cellulomonas rhizosphaerae]